MVAFSWVKDHIIFVRTVCTWCHMKTCLWSLPGASLIVVEVCDGEISMRPWGVQKYKFNYIILRLHLSKRALVFYIDSNYNVKWVSNLGLWRFTGSEVEGVIWSWARWFSPYLRTVRIKKKKKRSNCFRLNYIYISFAPFKSCMVSVLVLSIPLYKIMFVTLDKLIL